MQAAFQRDIIDLKKVAYDSPQNELVANLRRNIHAFAVAKSHQELIELQELLIDPETNQIKPFEAFKKDVEAIHNTFNKSWLKSEYNHAVGQAQMAVQWKDFEAAKDEMPYLTYETAGDSQVRDDHRRLDGITRPLDDPFWRTHYPRNDWGCRCTVVQTNDASKVTHKKVADTAARKTVLPPMFRRNAGKTEVIYDQQHPYFKEGPILGDLEAVTHYGMQSITSIYNRTGKMAKVETSDFNQWWNKQSMDIKGGIVVSDRNNSKVLFSKEVFKESKYASAIKDVQGKANEIWGLKNGNTVYLRYYQNRCILTEVNPKLEAIRFETFDPDAGTAGLEVARKGILLHRNGK